MGSVTNMSSMFNEATSFNQDLSGWCVTNIKSEPSEFAVGSGLTAPFYPNWGSCVMTSAEEVELLPTGFALQQNYPNPFNPSTSISFELPQATNVNISVYNMLGQEVKTLVDEFRSVGVHNVTFDASGLSSGVYIYRLVTPSQSFTKQMMLLK